MHLFVPYASLQKIRPVSDPYPNLCAKYLLSQMRLELIIYDSGKRRLYPQPVLLLCAEELLSPTRT